MLTRSRHRGKTQLEHLKHYSTQVLRLKNEIRKMYLQRLLVPEKPDLQSMFTKQANTQL